MLELLISIVIFMIVIGAAYGLLEVTRAGRSTNNQLIEVNQNARVALNTIGRELFNSGSGFPLDGIETKDNTLSQILFGVDDTDSLPDQLTPVISGDNLNSNTLSGCTNCTDRITILSADETFNNGKPLEVTVKNQGKVEVTKQPPDAVAGSLSGFVFNTNDVYLIRGTSGVAAIGMATGITNNKFIDFAPNDPLLLNQSANGNPSSSSQLTKVCSDSNPNCDASLTRLRWVTYQVLADGTLVRTTYGNQYAKPGANLDAPVIQNNALIYNVEDMQIKYILGNSAYSQKNGVLVDDPTLYPGPDQIFGTQDDGKMNDIRQVRISIRVRSARPDIRNNQYTKITLTSTFSTRNLGYESD